MALLAVCNTLFFSRDASLGKNKSPSFFLFSFFFVGLAFLLVVRWSENWNVKYSYELRVKIFTHALQMVPRVFWRGWLLFPLWRVQKDSSWFSECVEFSLWLRTIKSLNSFTSLNAAFLFGSFVDGRWFLVLAWRLNRSSRFNDMQSSSCAWKCRTSVWIFWTLYFVGFHVQMVIWSFRWFRADFSLFFFH